MSSSSTPIFGGSTWFWSQSSCHWFCLPQPGDEATAETVYRLTAVAVGIQVALGIVYWLSNSEWRLGILQDWPHPIHGLAALSVLHAFIGRARKGDHELANGTCGLVSS